MTLNFNLDTGAIDGFVQYQTEQDLDTFTTVSFSDIPPNISHIKLLLSNVSSNSSNSMEVQLGDSGGTETSGYNSTSNQYEAGSNSASGFSIHYADLSDIIDGEMLLVKKDTPGEWISSHWFRSSTSNVVSGGGRKNLSGELTQILIKVPDSESFDLGTVNILVW